MARPDWPYALGEETFIALLAPIVKVTRSQGVVTLHQADGEIEMPEGFLTLFRFKPHSASLFMTNWRGELARQRLAEIAAWKKQEELDRRKYERLKLRLEP